MDHKSLLAPAVVLILWTLVVLLWTAITRLGTMRRLGINLAKVPPGGRGQNLEGVLPDRVMWKSHNYAHLVEQPTLFYAIIALLALTPTVTPTTVALAWAYTAIRIVHSLWQALVNTLAVRFTLFILATSCLAALAIIAACGIFA